MRLEFKPRHFEIKEVPYTKGNEKDIAGYDYTILLKVPYSITTREQVSKLIDIIIDSINGKEIYV